ETDRIVRRILTRLRSLRYNGFEETAKQRTLEEAKKLLSGLSEKQMGDVIAALEKANISSGDARTAELKKAQQKNTEFVLGLKDVLAKFNSVRDLDEAAGRLDALARSLAEHSFRTTQLTWESEHVVAVNRKLSTRPGRLDTVNNDSAFVRKDYLTLA